MECSISLFFVFFFNSEFKENGNNNNTSSVPVSMASLLMACYRIVSSGCFLVLRLICLWRQELDVQVGLVKDEFPGKDAQDGSRNWGESRSRDHLSWTFLC